MPDRHDRAARFRRIPVRPEVLSGGREAPELVRPDGFARRAGEAAAPALGLPPPPLAGVSSITRSFVIVAMFLAVQASPSVRWTAAQSGLSTMLSAHQSH